jgi:hypothetical protein
LVLLELIDNDGIETLLDWLIGFTIGLTVFFLTFGAVLAVVLPVATTYWLYLF